LYTTYAEKYDHTRQFHCTVFTTFRLVADSRGGAVASGGDWPYFYDKFQWRHKILPGCIWLFTCCRHC